MEASDKYLLCNHIDCVLDAAIRNDREDRGIDHTQFLDTVDLELAIDDAFFDVLGKACSSTWILFQSAKFRGIFTTIRNNLRKPVCDRSKIILSIAASEARGMGQG
jgi:hypothetical protein